MTQKIFEDFVNGKAIFAIARELNFIGRTTSRNKPWSSTTVSYILRNPTYIGKLVHNNDPTKNTRDSRDKSILDGNHPPIISTEIWNKAYSIIEKTDIANKKYCRKDAISYKPYLLHGLLKCSSCGHAMVRVHSYSTYEAYQCCDYNHGRCKDNHRVRLPEMNNAVLDTIETLFDNDTFILDVRYKQEHKIKADTTSIIAKEKQKLQRIADAYEDGVYTLEEFKERRQSVETHIQQLELAKNEQQQDETKIRAEFINTNKKLLEQLRSEAVSDGEKNDILHSFVDKIIFNKANNSMKIFFYYCL